MSWTQQLESQIGWFAKPWDTWHEVVDEVFVSDDQYPDGHRRFLLACRHWNSEGWVTRDGRALVENPPGGGAPHCDTSTMGEPSSWELWQTPANGRIDALFMRTADVWHECKSTGVEVTREHDAVYLSVCGSWATSRAIAKVTRSARRPAPRCANCGRGGEERDAS